jgi:glycosyltransferase involved in cell wall biosynthesis
MIAIVYPQFYGVGGIARYLNSFLANLPKDAPKVYLITGDDGARSIQFSGVEIIHVPLTSGRLSLLIWGLRARSILQSLHRQGNVKVANYHCPPLIPALFIPRGMAVVLTPHSTYKGLSGRLEASKHFKSPWNPLAVQVKIWMEYYIFSRARELICLTPKAKRELAHYNYGGAINIIPNGVDVESFSCPDGISKDIDVIFVGRIEVPKGSRSMVEVCKKLILDRPGIKILIVGYGADEFYVRQQLAPYPECVTMTGIVPFTEVSRYLARSRLYASTSYYEGLPGTCLEAMAMQLPVVVWNLPFYNDLVVDGESGSLVGVDNNSDFVQQILGLLDSPQVMSRMGIAGRKWLVDNYNWRKLAVRLIDVMRRAASEAR